MMGRAGRPQYDDHGVAVVLVQDIKKDFYKRFLYEPFPVESSLIQAIPDHINAEIVAGTISSKQQCLDYLTWTYFFRRLLKNPGYYALEDTELSTINRFLSGLVNRCIKLLISARCVLLGEDERHLSSTILGRIASYYYISHKTLEVFREHLRSDNEMDKLLWILSEAHEYDELPVRHNEDVLNGELAKDCPIQLNVLTYDKSHTKANLLLQAHFSRISLPCADYYTDLKSVLDQAIRIIQAMIDVCSDKGYLRTTLSTIMLLQMVLQARWHNDNTLLTLPHVEQKHLGLFKISNINPRAGSLRLIDSLPELMENTSFRYEALASVLRDQFAERQVEAIHQTLRTLPKIELTCSITGHWESDVEQQKKIISLNQASGIRTSHHSYPLHADQEYFLDVKLTRLSKGKTDSKAIAPKFPKPKDEGWFLILGIVDSRELVAMKRVPFVSHSSTHQLFFIAPEKTGKVIYTLFLMSDCYLGLDQQYDICFDVKSPISIQDDEQNDPESSDSEDDDSDDSDSDSDSSIDKSSTVHKR